MPAAAPGRSMRSLSWVVVAGIALLLLLPGGVLAAPRSSAPGAGGTGGRATTAVSGPVRSPPAGTPAGLDPAAEAPVPSAYALQTKVAALLAAPPGNRSAAGSGRSPGSSPPAGASPHPFGGLNGWFTGTVANASRPTDVLDEVFVGAVPDTSADPCTYQACGPGTTGTNGGFNVSCPSGADYLVASIAEFAQNLTYATCTGGATVSVGTILLLPDGWVTGRVVGDVPGAPGLGSVAVTGQSRSGSVFASPTNLSANVSGTFHVPVPPELAAEVTFNSANLSYESNLTWVTVASGATVDLGTVYLEPVPEATVRAMLVDAVTGAPIVPTLRRVHLYLCQGDPSNATPLCGQEGESNNATVTATGPSGPSYVIATAPGYVDNITPVGNIAPAPANDPQCLPGGCRIEMVPLGELSAGVGLSGDPAALFDGSSANGANVTFVTRSLAGYWTEAPCVLFQYCNVQRGTQMMAAGGQVGQPFSMAAFPSWNDVQLRASGSTPGLVPADGNWTDANVTPDEITSLGWFNLTPGTYVEGNVYANGSALAPPGGFVVTVTSRIGLVATDYGVFPAYTGNGSILDCTQNGSGPHGGPTSFCVAAPIGPDLLTVGARNGQYQSNQTAIRIPYSVCCLRTSAANGSIGPFALSAVTSPSVASVNLTLVPTANLSGAVVSARSGAGVPYASVEACPSYGTSVCVLAGANASGDYVLSGVPLGWEVVSAYAGAFVSNSETLQVDSSMTVPTLPLPPEGLLAGTVEFAGGGPAVGASISACPLTNLSTCSTPLGPGLTNSLGEYEGYVAGGWLPTATYRVEATASGYGTEFTWANATVGNLTELPPMVLLPIGGGADRPPPETLRASAGAAPVWLAGRIVDASTGRGIDAASVAACPLPGTGGCAAPVAGVTNSGGFFNLSVPYGLYGLSASAPGYLSLTAPANATVRPTDEVGTLRLVEQPWVWGNVTGLPWSTIWVYLGTNRTPITLAPAASVQLCQVAVGNPCGPPAPVGSGGAFYVAAPNSTRALLLADAPIFDFSFEPVNLTPGQAGLPTAEWPQLTIWSTVYGLVGNAASAVPSGGTFSDPVRWALVDVQNVLGAFYPSSGVTPPVSGLPPVDTTAGGTYVTLAPSGGTKSSANVTVGEPARYYPVTETLPVLLGPPGNLTYAVAPIGLDGFGWAEGQLVDSVTGLPLRLPVGVVASYSNPSTGQAGSTSGTSGAHGFLNLSAPAGRGVLFVLAPVGAYNGSSLRASVVAGATTWLGGPGGTNSTPVPIAPDGYVASAEVNYSADGAGGALFDPAVGQPVPNAVVIANSSDSAYGGPVSPQSNAAGQFLAFAPIGAADRESVSAVGYLPETIGPLRVTAGNLTDSPRVNLTAYGVVAGRVIVEPGGAPAVGASVSVCPSGAGALCRFGVTNDSGIYWIAAPPGPANISATLPGYLGNETITASPAPDRWVWGGTLSLLGDSIVEGTVRGLPTGEPLAGANASLCSPLGTPSGPCDYSVLTSSDGAFTLYAVPASFVLLVSAPEYNTSVTPLSVPGGSTVNLGNVFLEEDGIVAGVVEQVGTGVGIPGATVFGCVDEQPSGPCTPAGVTAANGRYVLTVPPGRVVVLASAGGFGSGAAVADVPSGGEGFAPPIRLTPVAGLGPFEVAGRVLLGNASLGVRGATVSLSSGNVLAAGTTTNGTGGFELAVGGGAYTLAVDAPGAIPFSEPIQVVTNRTGLVVALAPWEWPVAVWVVDGLTRDGVPSAVTVAGGPAVLSDLSGRATFALPNGTFALTVTPNPGSPDRPAAASLVVTGGPLQVEIAVYPAVATIVGRVGGASGAPVPDTNVTLEGDAADGAAILAEATSGPGGEFALSAYMGTYRVLVSAPGYEPAAITVDLPPGSRSINLSLRILEGGSSGPGGPPTAAIYGAGLALLGIAAALGVWGGRRRRPPPPVPVPASPASFQWGAPPGPSIPGPPAATDR